MPQPLCFVLMPFGQKPNAKGVVVDFDAVYAELIRPSIEAAGLEAIRADEERLGGVIHKAMFERLILCRYALADLSLVNANVYYELGIRHAVRPHTTLTIFSEGVELPFDVRTNRGVPYQIDSKGRPIEVDAAVAAISDMLRAAQQNDVDDSPLFQLVGDLPWRNAADQLPHARTDVFRERARYAEQAKQKLQAARNDGVVTIQGAEKELVEAAGGTLAAVEAGIAVDLLLSYRAVKAWGEMVRVYEAMDRPLQRTSMVREQVGFALNRQAGDAVRAEDHRAAETLRARAVAMLKEVIAEHGPNPETNGILGRVFKDCWQEAADRGNAAASGYLKQAINAYLEGFEADWRDAYPGVNAVTLMEFTDPIDPRQAELLRVVEYAVDRRIASTEPDYWDYATRLELAVLSRNQSLAAEALGDALAVVRETWEPETTARNLRLILEARQRRGEDTAWIDTLVSGLDAKA